MNHQYVDTEGNELHIVNTRTVNGVAQEFEATDGQLYVPAGPGVLKLKEEAVVEADVEEEVAVKAPPG